jgi:hypothetical protein
MEVLGDLIGGGLMAKVAIELHYLEFDDYCTLEVVVSSPLVVMR